MTFKVEETTIAQIHDAYRSKSLTCVELAAQYLARIEAYDRGGPTINSIVSVNPDTEAQAAALDRAWADAGGPIGPLHGVPVVVKDQAETAGIMTAFGCIANAGYVPEKDATAIKKLRDAGALILAKTAMPDFATSWFGYSSMSGTTKNPYDLDRDPGGSSGGTGAAVSANLGAIGVGEDTGGSIRLPSSFDNLVGLKVTPGLISRTGMSPLVVFQDSAGPMCRTVTDTAILLEALAGYDPEDPYTATAAIAGPQSYAARLDANALQGATIGVVRALFGSESDAEAAAVNGVMQGALAALADCGATLVDVDIPDCAHYVEYTSLYINHSRHDIDKFLASRPQLPMRTVREIFEAKKYHPALDLFEAVVEGPEDPYADPEYLPRYTARETFQRIVVNEMAKAGATALVFPTTQIPSPTRAELDAGRWTTFTYPTNTLVAAQTWMPAMSVPAGFTPAGVPVGMEIVGLPYREGDLLALAYAFEQATQHRRAPASTPALD